ncbi:hypothetical protein EYF80_040600 [Liparis tanakae]|uniref:Uncharacterized protein n=1 Tax=Liparis tanakae TaxID=230148 RepID=A0A4Z2G7G6_9TELE|nr:hypothetical protein EYF80_040600 [Liparis tanakae]
MASVMAWVSTSSRAQHRFFKVCDTRHQFSRGPSYLVTFSLNGRSTWPRCFSKSTGESSSSA